MAGMNDISLNHLLDVAICAAEAAGKHAMANLGRRKEATAVFDHDIKLVLDIECQAVAEGIAIATYRPLLMGVLAGKYALDAEIPADSRGQTDPRVAAWLAKFGDGLRRFNQFAADRDLHPAQVAVAWQRHSPGVTTPIIGVSSQRQLRASLAAFDVTLSDDEYAELTGMFDTAVKEEAGGAYPGLRRALDLVAADA